MGNTNFLSTTGSPTGANRRKTPILRIAILDSLASRSAENCKAYVKPGVKLEELDEELDSSCGCNPGPPVKCTGLEFSTVGVMLKCEVSENCKKAIQEIDDLWIEEPPTTNIKCLTAFKLNKMLSVMCINWLS